jgi:hypothetical protein
VESTFSRRVGDTPSSAEAYVSPDKQRHPFIFCLFSAHTSQRIARPPNTYHFPLSPFELDNTTQDSSLFDLSHPLFLRIRVLREKDGSCPFVSRLSALVPFSYCCRSNCCLFLSIYGNVIICLGFVSCPFFAPHFGRLRTDFFRPFFWLFVFSVTLRLCMRS